MIFCKNTICLFFVAWIAFFLSVKADCPQVSAKAAVLLEQSTGTVLAGKNETRKLPMASTTKIMTAIVALEHGNLDDVVTVSKAAAYTEGSSMYLHVGEQLPLESLIYGLMLNSGNDAAIAIAEHISGSVSAFAALMNETAKKIGAKDTSFQNPNGLDAEGHYTTAYDLALITRYGMKNERFRQIVQAKTKTVDLDGKPNGRVLVNHNKMLKFYPGCDGVKTGFTKKSGRCLVSSATRDGMQLIAVTLHAPDDWNDHTHLLNYGFDTYQLWQPDIPVQECQVPGGTCAVSAQIKEPVSILIRKEEKNLYRSEIRWNEQLKPPLKKNQAVGKVVLYKGDQEMERRLLIAQNDVEVLIPKPTYLELLKRLFTIMMSERNESK